MQDSSRDGPRGVSNINANGGIVNQVGRDQCNNYHNQYNHNNQYNNSQYYHNYNNVMNDEMVVRQSYQ
jgi:hypothetical protein